MAFLPLAHAHSASESAAGWLSRASRASRSLDYEGLFVVQQGTRNSEFRLLHRVTRDGEHLQIEPIDRQTLVLRDPDAIRLFHWRDGTEIIQPGKSRSPFFVQPPVVNASALARYYQMSLGPTAHYAGRACRIIDLTPLDQLRYSHRFCIDTTSGLILHSHTSDVRGDRLESFTMTRISIAPLTGTIGSHTGTIGSHTGTIEPFHDLRHRPLRVIRSAVRPVSRDDPVVTLSLLPPGFRILGRTVCLFHDRGAAEHLLLSDGLASISVFIEFLNQPQGRIEVRMLRQGGTSILRTSVDGHQVTLVGEVPANVLRMIADGISVSSPHTSTPQHAAGPA